MTILDPTPSRDTDPRLRQIADLRAGNTRMAQELAGVGRSLHPQIATQVQLSTLIEVLAEMDPELGVRFTLAWEEKAAELLANGLSEARRATLLGGVGQ